MIILEQANRILKDTLNEHFQLAKDEKYLPIDMTCADFDEAIFHVYTPEGSTLLNVSLKAICYSVLDKCNSLKHFKSIYSEYTASTEQGWDVTLSFDLKKLPQDHEALSNRISLIKRHLYASAYHHAFESIQAGKSDMLDIPFRSGERTFIIPSSDRCTIIYAINFSDSDDITLGKVFLNEFKKSVGGAPSFDFTHNAIPGELSKIKNLDRADGYITCVLFDRHYKPESMEKTIDMLIQLRNYLMYHIKCSKSHLNTRMRCRVESMLKVLNRAKQELPKEKKTATGRTFTRSSVSKKN